MTEERLKCIALFIMEALFLQDTNIIDELFAFLFNKFIEQCYHEENKLLPILYDNKDLLKEFIEEGYPFLTCEQMHQLLTRYGEFNGYVKLLDDIGYQKDTKINDLVLQFIKYQQDYFQEIENLYNADPKQYYPKGFPRILQ